VIERDSGGAWLGKYDLIAELPREGAEDVYLAAVIAPGGYTRLAVIRMVRPTLTGEGLFPKFLAAARIGALLNHANIVETYEISQGGATGTDGAKAFVAMEYLEGQTLARMGERIGAAELGRGMRLRILVDVLAGLHHAHEAVDDAGAPLHIRHLRLAPSSVFVTYDGQVKLLDFGRFEAQEESERTRALARRATYLAPEQARAEEADRRADIFAVGVMLWEASTRTPLWGELDERAILAELAAGRIPSLRKVDPSVPAPLADIVGRALAFAADDRYSTAMHMQTDLEGFLRASGDRPSPREIGRVVAHAFLEERLRTTTIVDEQLRRLRARSFSTDDEQPLSLLRIETLPAATPSRPGEVQREMPTAPRPFTPVASLAPKSRRGPWVVGLTAIVLVLTAVAVFYAR
jgi:serine/threonine-protein kinase